MQVKSLVGRIEVRTVTPLLTTILEYYVLQCSVV